MKIHCGKFLRLFSWMALIAVMLAGCGSRTEPDAPEENDVQSTMEENQDTPESAAELTVRFGSGSDAFILRLEDNQTAKDIATHVGTASWNLPIYHYDDYDGWETMQYYDIPSRYEITAAPEEVTSEKAGEVYYSAPNRIVLFYHDAEISGEYTFVGTFDPTDEFVAAVENNPVLEGWGNKLVSISPN